MQLRYGTASFPANGVEVSSTTRLLRSDAGRPVRYVTAFACSGQLEGDGQVALSVLALRLRAALLIPYQTLTLLTDTGAASSHTLASSASLSGVVVTDGPHFTGELGGAEFATVLSFAFTGEAEFDVPSGRSAILSFQETVSVVGTGGPAVRWRPAINGRPVRQIVYPSTTVRATQAGRAVKHDGYPTAPPPLWPAAEHQDRRQVSPGSPRRLGPNALAEYPLSWSYEFEAAGPLVGFPGIPPL